MSPLHQPTSSPTNTPLTATSLTAAPSVLCESLETGAVLLDLDTGRYFELDANGLMLWQRLNGERTVSDLAACLVSAYGIPPEQALADTESFVRGLCDAGLLTAAGVR